MKKVLVIIPHSHTWFWTQTCLQSLHNFPPVANGVTAKVVVVNNSLWSPAIKGISDTRLSKDVELLDNTKSLAHHATALDFALDTYAGWAPDYVFTLETDVVILRPDWLEWYIEQIERQPNWYAIGHWHHELFISPNSTLYRAAPLYAMNDWCKRNNNEFYRWGEEFRTETPLPWNIPLSSLQGPFSEKRGWPAGTVLNERPTGLTKGPGWYEPGQQLYHWARNNGDMGYLACPTHTEWKQEGMPIATRYGPTPEEAYTCHFWGGTRALDLLKHPVTDPFVSGNMGFWLQREIQYWRSAVPKDLQRETLALIKKHGWLNPELSNPTDTKARADEAVKEVERLYGIGR